MATSTAQQIPLIELYDYVLASGDPAASTTSKGKSGLRVKATLQYDRALTIAPDAVVWAAGDATYATLTDGNGFWHLFLTPNNKISPANTYYTIEIEGGISYKVQVTDVGVPAPGWQSSAPGILLDIPASLAPTTSTVGAITATGLITAQAGINVTAGGATIAGGLTVTGGESAVGGLTVDKLTFSSAVGQLVPGATSLSWRNNANNADNLIITDAGNATLRGSLTVTAGPLTVSAGGASITGGLTVVTGGLTVSAGGAAVTGNSTVTGTLTVTALLTAQAGATLSGGNLTITAGNLTFGAAVSTVIPGATGLFFENHANTATNLEIDDNGLLTARNALKLPPSAGGTIPTTSYGTVPVKIDDQLLGASSAQITFVNPLPTGFRHLLVEWYARGDTAAGNTGVLMRVNNISTATYDWARMEDTNNTIAGIDTVGATAWTIGFMAANTATAGYFGQGEAKLKNYNGTTGNKIITAESFMMSADTVTTILNHRIGGKWRTTGTAVTRIDLIPSAGNFVAGSIFTLWGIP